MTVRSDIAHLRDLLRIDEALRVTPDDLPEDPWRYFHKTSDVRLVPMSKVRITNERSSRAARFMAMAYNGSGEKRSPVILRREDDGGFSVVDGNGTATVAKAQRWKYIPATVVEAGSLRDLLLQLEQTYPPGTVRKWKNGTYIKTREGTWIPYQGKGHSQKISGEPKTAPASSGVLSQLADLQKQGVLPKDVSPEEHVSRAKKFLERHQKSFQATYHKLQELAEGEGVAVMGRVKELESALGKLTRKPKVYQTADDLTDGSGFRIVCGSVEDVLKNVENLRKTYKVVEEEDFIKTPNGGYRSFHMIIEDENGLRKEVQLRTPNQDTWANWCHDVYKPQTSEQDAAVKKAKPVIMDYGQKMSDYYFAKDQGKKPPTPPDCPEVVQETFGCMPT